MSGLGDMGNLLKQAQEMQRQLDRVRGELRSRMVEGTAGGGVVRVEVSVDRQEVKAVTVAPEVLAQHDATMVGDLVKGALQDALRRAADLERQELGKVTGGMDLPGML